MINNHTNSFFALVFLWEFVQKPISFNPWLHSSRTSMHNYTHANRSSFGSFIVMETFFFFSCAKHKNRMNVHELVTMIHLAAEVKHVLTFKGVCRNNSDLYALQHKNYAVIQTTLFCLLLRKWLNSVIKMSKIADSCLVSGSYNRWTPIAYRNINVKDARAAL